MKIPTTTPTLSSQVRTISAGQQSARNTVEAALRRIHERESELHAWVLINDAAPDEAEHAVSGPLAGTLVGVKDIIDVAGMPSRCGSGITSTHPVAKDAACVARLRELGAVIGGKTVTTEFGYFSPGPTRNPANVQHTPGGSSSGSAAAVAAGTIPLALGTQTAGSLTRPASYCGAAGLTLTQGSTDLNGVTGLSRSLDTLGLLAGNVTDLKYFYEAFTGTPPFAGQLPKIAYHWPGSALHPIEPEMAAAVDFACGVLRELGVVVQELALDDHVATLTEDQVTVMSFEAWQEHGERLVAHREQISEPLYQLLQDGANVSAAAYEAALARRDRTLIQLTDLLNDQGLVIGPAAPSAAPPGIGATGSPVLSRAWQLLGLPVVTVPGLANGEGMPLGIQLIAPAGREHSALALAEALEHRLRQNTERKGKNNA